MKAALLLASLVLALPAGAIERIRLRAAQVETGDRTLVGVDATLHIPSATRSSADLRVARVVLSDTLTAQTGTLRDLRLHCENPLLREPRFACPAFMLQASSSRWGTHTLRGDAAFRSDDGTLRARGSGITLAGASLSFSVEGDAANFVAEARLPGIQIADVVKLAAAQVPAVQRLGPTGRSDLDARISRRDGRTNATLRLTLSDLAFQNEEFTWIGEKLALALQVAADVTAAPYSFAVQMQGSKGQALAGPVLLDFDKNPLQLDLAAEFSGRTLQITQLRSRQRDLADVSGNAQIVLLPLSVRRADVAITNLQFPAAYTSYLQVPLATTAFNQLSTSGTAEARLSVLNNAPVSLEFVLRNLAFSDSSRNLAVAGVNSEIHWTADITTPRASWLGWESSRGWGIEGARSRLDFTTSGRDFQLLKPARLPFFDGALVISTLAAENIGSEQLSGVFDAVIEPISVAPIAKALGWPEFAGQLSGRIPGLTYKEGLLSLQGNLEADVFDGRVVARDLRVRDPLGAWPRLYGNITARHLDLDLITRTFEFGSITGRLDVDLTSLETFNWTPVAFDLRLATSPGDRSRHRISQRAVQNLSDIGGGGGGVAAALQSGALKFFDDFGYDRLGLSCRLRNDVCQMDGVGRAGTGFYIVKGRGLPRIDIIGNNQRVDWPLLMQQVSEALENPEGIDVN